MTEDNTTEFEVQDSEPNHIEIVVKERTPSRPRICQLFDKVKHKKSPEFIEDFKLLHPECF
jgi:hypothetical protein